MSRLTRFVAIVAAVMLVLTLFLPPVLGIIFAHIYQDVIKSYNDEGNVKLEIVKFDRGWFHSKSILNVEIYHPSFLKIVNNLSNPPYLSNLKFTIVQYIHHGPIFFGQFPDLHSVIGLATIQNTVQPSSAILQFLKSIGLFELPLKTDTDFISVTGSYLKKMEFKPILFNDPTTKTRVFLKSGDIWIWPNIGRIKGMLKLNNVMVDAEQQNFNASQINLHFDQKRNANGLWLGSGSLNIPEMQFNEAEGDTIFAKGIDFSGSVTESNGAISGYREFVIKNLQINDQIIGPLRLQISVRNLNSEGIEHVFDTYEKITNRGELYESQLRLRIFSLLPSIFNANTRISLDALTVITAKGDLKATGDITWQRDKFDGLDSLKKLYQASSIRMNLRISKTLADEIISLISKYFYGYQLPSNDNQVLNELRNDIRFVNRINTVLMADLVQNKLISEQNGVLFLNLQNKVVLPDYYNSVIKQLFLEKQFIREVSYLLYWQYIALQQQITQLTQQEKQFQSAYAKKIRTQLDGFIQKGYIVENDNDFILSFVRENGVVKLNNKKL